MSSTAYKKLIATVVGLLIGGAAMAQNQSACPGFLNTTTFSTGSSTYFWSARVGERCYPVNNYDTTTGYYVMSTCASPNAQAIVGHSNITSSTYNSGADGGINCCGDGSLWDANDSRFQIITADNAGLDQFTINNGVGMQRIPDGYLTSIRLGDPRATGQASHSSTHEWSSTNTNRGSEALFYTMQVTSQNALLFVNYAVVGRCYSHTAREAGEFLIRVVKQNDDGTWPNYPVNDSLWFKVSAPALPTNGQPVAPWVMGRPGTACSSTTCGYVYKPWTKVAINLNEYLYENVRIEMYTSDCIYDVDPIYAYISGDFQPMTLLTTGCPDPESDVIDTLHAPEGMISYRWLVSRGNAEPNHLFFNNAHMDTVPFQQVYPATGVTEVSTFAPRLEHFILTAGDSIGDTVAEKTFLCIMTSAMDPNKPFESKLYVNVTNTRPIMRQWHEAECDGTVHFRNDSYCVGTAYIVSDSTTWEIYNADGDLVTVLTGDLVDYRFTDPGTYTCRLTCRSAVTGNTEGGCTAALEFDVIPIISPNPVIVADLSLCDGDTLIAHAENYGDLELKWYVDDELVDSSVAIKMLLPLGMHTITLVGTGSDGCVVTVGDTLYVYGVPVINGVSAVCLGESATLTAAGSSAYQWQSVPPDPAIDAQQGQTTITVSPTVTTTYSIAPDPGNPCSVDGASHFLEVIPTPVPIIAVNPPTLEAERPSLTLSDLSENQATTLWQFSDGSTDQGQTVRHTFTSFGDSDVGISMHTCNRLECCADTAITVPVTFGGLWIPNVFTPGDDLNNRFKIIASYPMTDFMLYIYDRSGHLVYTTDDPDAGWDGRDLDGRPCPQGAYSYRYRFSKYGVDHHSDIGTVTLLR